MEADKPSVGAFKRAILIVGVAFSLGLFFDFFFYSKIPGIGFPIYIVLIVAGLFFVSARVGRTLDKQVIWLLVPLMFFSAMVFVRSSGLLTFLNVVGSLLLLLLIAELSSAREIKSFSTEDYLAIGFVPFKFFEPMGQTIRQAVPERNLQPEQKALLSQVAKGTLMALPALLVFIGLFSSADLVFRNYAASVFEIHLDGESVLRLLLVLLVASVFIGAYSYIFRPTQEPTVLPEREKFFSIGPIETLIFLGSISSLFLLFIVIQFTYLFGGERNITIPGVTYAEYARSGFFELIAVAVLSLLILRVMDECVDIQGASASTRFKALSSILVAEVIVIMLSAFKRLLLYERAYGFTTLRLYSHVFIVFLAVIFVLLLHKIVKDTRENTFAFGSLIAIIVFLAGMNLLNPDRFIARRNLENFTASGKLDVFYLADLSDDAMPEMVEFFNKASEDQRRELGRRLSRRLQARTSDPFYTRWQSLNLSRVRAKQILEINRTEIEIFGVAPSKM